VFLEKNGFDVIIANPPYIGEKGHKELFSEVKKANLKEYYLGKRLCNLFSVNSSQKYPLFFNNRMTWQRNNACRFANPR
jgi:type I restriction-modification system DNA methylase subunit